MDMDLNDPLMGLGQLAGLDITPGYLIGSFIFGVIGLYLFRAGKKRVNYRVIAVSVGLMGYPLLITGTWMVWCVGLFLTALAYYFLNLE
jgi:hypothetical protein